MIYDTLDNLNAYRGIAPTLDKAIDFLNGLGENALPDGRIPIDGDQVYAKVTTAPRVQSASWEAHRAYIDVQVSVDGGETIEYLPVSQVEDWGAYRFDVSHSASAQPGIPLPMDKNRFAIFFPWDAHRPNLGSGEGRKLVVKVALEPR